MGLTRRQIASLFIAILLPLAGCGSATTADRTPRPTPEPTRTASPTPSPTPEPPTTDGNQSLEALAESKGVDAVGLNNTTKERVRSVVANFSENLPENETERRVALLDTADSVCQAKRQEYANEINLSAVENNATESKKLARRLHYSSQIVNERFTDDVPVSEFGKVRDGVSKASKYAPVLGSTQRFMEASCNASEERTNESIREFQIAAMMVGVDLVLASTGVAYSPAFKGTRFVMNTGSKVGLYRLRYVCGNRCWALAWSETHWALRGGMVKGIHETVSLTANTSLELTDEDVIYLSEKQRLNGSQSNELVSRLRAEGMEIGTDVLGHIEGCVGEVNASDAVENPEEAASDAQEKVEGVASGLLGEERNESTEEKTICG